MCGDPSLPLLPCLSFAAVCAVPVPEGEERAKLSTELSWKVLGYYSLAV